MTRFTNIQTSVEEVDEVEVFVVARVCRALAKGGGRDVHRAAQYVAEEEFCWYGIEKRIFKTTVKKGCSETAGASLPGGALRLGNRLSTMLQERLDSTSRTAMEKEERCVAVALLFSNDNSRFCDDWLFGAMLCCREATRYRPIKTGHAWRAGAYVSAGMTPSA